MRPIKRTTQRQRDCSGTTKLALLVPSNNELFRDDSKLLLSVASQFLHEEDCVDSSSAFAFPPIVDFPSFQALLHAATSAVPVDPQPDGASHPTLDDHLPLSTDVSTRTQKRRERNRISCRKTRLKRKMEHASEELLAHKRAEHNAFLSELHHELTRLAKQQQTRRDVGQEKLERQKIARQFIVRSLHFQLTDPECDASWCFEDASKPLSAVLSARRYQVNDSTEIKPGAVGDDPQRVLHEQWGAIVVDLETPSLEILQIQAEQESPKAESQSQVRCQWRLVGVSKQQLQSGRVEKAMVEGVTNVRFRGRSIESIDMCVT